MQILNKSILISKDKLNQRSMHTLNLKKDFKLSDKRLSYLFDAVNKNNEDLIFQDLGYYSNLSRKLLKYFGFESTRDQALNLIYRQLKEAHSNSEIQGLQTFNIENKFYTDGLKLLIELAQLAVSPEQFLGSIRIQEIEQNDVNRDESKNSYSLFIDNEECVFDKTVKTFFCASYSEIKCFFSPHNELKEKNVIKLAEFVEAYKKLKPLFSCEKNFEKALNILRLNLNKANFNIKYSILKILDVADLSDKPNHFLNLIKIVRNEQGEGIVYFDDIKISENLFKFSSKEELNYFIDYETNKLKDLDSSKILNSALKFNALCCHFQDDLKNRNEALRIFDYCISNIENYENKSKFLLENFLKISKLSDDPNLFLSLLSLEVNESHDHVFKLNFIELSEKLVFKKTETKNLKYFFKKTYSKKIDYFMNRSSNLILKFSNVHDFEFVLNQKLFSSNSIIMSESSSENSISALDLDISQSSPSSIEEGEGNSVSISSSSGCIAEFDEVISISSCVDNILEMKLSKDKILIGKLNLNNVIKNYKDDYEIIKSFHQNAKKDIIKLNFLSGEKLDNIEKLDGQNIFYASKSNILEKNKNNIENVFKLKVGIIFDKENFSLELYLMPIIEEQYKDFIKYVKDKAIFTLAYNSLAIPALRSGFNDILNVFLKSFNQLE